MKFFFFLLFFKGLVFILILFNRNVFFHSSFILKGSGFSFTFSTSAVNVLLCPPGDADGSLGPGWASEAEREWTSKRERERAQEENEKIGRETGRKQGNEFSRHPLKLGTDQTPDMNTHRRRRRRTDRGRELGQRSGGQTGGSLSFLSVTWDDKKTQLSEPENELETADLQTDGEIGGERRDRLTCCHHCTRQRKKWLVFRSSNLRVHNFYTRLARDFFVCLFDWLIFDSMNSSVQFCAKQQKTNELGVRKLTSDAEKDVLIEQRPMVCNELIYSFVSLLSFT